MHRSFVSFVSLVLFAAPLPCAAQTSDSIGIRAQGMGGAFTAVADDATATWWNPAGLATGAYLSALVEYGRLDEPETTHRGIAAGFPAFGFGYYRFTVSQIRPFDSTAAPAAGRQDNGAFAARALPFSQFGATLGQSISTHLVVASTLKLVRGLGETHGGLDIGVLGRAGATRFGVMVRNANEATFGEGVEAVTLERQARAGLAVMAAGGRYVNGATLAVDSDLNAVTTMTGEERRAAVGGELWLMNRRLGVRGGLSASTLGERRSARSAGVSIAPFRGIYVDGELTGGSDTSRHGWGLALRVTF